jgi:hypothetical protein
LVNGRDSVEVAAWSRTTSANLMPWLQIIWYGPEGDDTLLATSNEPFWTPIASASMRRVFAAATAAGAERYRVALAVRAGTAGQTGTVWFDDVTVNGTDVVFAEPTTGLIQLDVAVRSRWVE